MNAELYHTNLAALRRVLPGATISAIEEAGRSPLGIVAEQGASDINLDLGASTLYGGGAAAYAGSQVARFRADPNRLSFDPPRIGSRWVKGEGDVYQSLIDRFGPLPDPADGNTDVPVGALVSLGVGLGLHLPLLQGSFRYRDLILVEPYAHFLEASLRVLDWTKVLDGLAEAGGALHLFTGDDPAALAAQAFEALRKGAFARLDGSYVFTHYNSPTLDRTRDLFAQQVPTLGSSLGFVEDECVMIRNAVTNLAGPKGSIAKAEQTPRTDLPTLVVGTGPSLDDAIEEIRRLRKDAVLISGGTALSALLEQGIAPDLHCEVENDPETYDGLFMVAERHDLSSIPLLCTATIDPRIPGLFGDVLFYFQDRVTSSVLFEGDFGRWRHAAPTVTNLALRAGAWLGSGRIYFFGLDLGSKSPDKHHSDASYYNWTDDEYLRSGTGMDRFEIPLPGNFGGTAYTNLALLFTTAFFNAFAAAHRDISLINCSDGVRIENTTPTRPGAVKLPAAPISGAEVIAGAVADCTPINAIVAQMPDTVAVYERSLDRWMTEARNALASSTGLDAALSSLGPLLDQSRPGTPADRAACACYSGTMLLILQYAFAHHRRLPAAARADFDQAALATLSAHLDIMAAMTERTLTELRASVL